MRYASSTTPRVLRESRTLAELLSFAAGVYGVSPAACTWSPDGVVRVNGQPTKLRVVERSGTRFELVDSRA